MADDIVRPDGDIATPWSTATPHWNKINESVEQPTAGDGTYIRADDEDDAETEEFSLTTISGVLEATQVVVWFYGRASTDGYGVTLNIQIDGVWQTGQWIAYSNGTTWSWYSATWSSLSMSQSDLDGMLVSVTSTDNIAKDDWIDVDTLYCKVTYTPSLLEKDLTEEIGVSDALTKMLIREYSEGVGISDLKELVSSYVREHSEGLEISDLKTFLISKIYEEGIGISDAKKLISIFIKEYTEGIGINDSISTITSFFRELSEGVGISDNFSRIGTFIRSFTEGVGVSDVIANITSYIRGFSEGLGVSDQVISSLLFFKALEEGLGISDSVSDVASFVREYAEELGISDEYSKIVSYIRELSEGVGISDLESNISSFVKGFTEGVGISDNYTGISSFIKILEEGIGVNDSIENVVAYIRGFTEGIGISDDFLSVLTIVKALEESIGVSDGISNVNSYVREYLEGIGVSDVESFVGSYIRDFIEGLGISDLPAIAKNVVRPDGDLLTEWFQMQSELHWQVLDDPIQQPSAGDGNVETGEGLIIAGKGVTAGGVIDRLSMSTFQLKDEYSVVKIKLWIRWGVITETSLDLTVDVKLGIWLGEKTVSYDSQDYIWTSFEWDLAGDQADLDNMEVKLIADDYFGENEAIFVDAVYVEVTSTKIYIFDPNLIVDLNKYKLEVNSKTPEFEVDIKIPQLEVNLE